jgi:phage N-6-adenine-methyltransferase
MSYNKNYSPSSNERETPWRLYELLNKEFCFVADMAATASNTKHKRFFTTEDDSLSIDWPRKHVFLNPPYSRGLLPKFVAKAREEAIKGSKPVLLLPASTSSGWWVKYVSKEDYNLSIEIRFLTPRVPFLINGKPMLSKSGKPTGAMTPNVIVTFEPHTLGKPRLSVYWFDWKNGIYV